MSLIYLFTCLKLSLMDIFVCDVNINGFQEMIKLQQFVLNVKAHIGIHQRAKRYKIIENVPLFHTQGLN